MQEKIENWLKENLVYDYEIIDEKYFIGRFDMIFGTRIRGGYLFDSLCQFDVCCGKIEPMLIKVKEIYTAKIKKNLSEGKQPNDGLRVMSEVKPIHNDPEFLEWLISLQEELKNEV